jgi:hypothetical protein
MHWTAGFRAHFILCFTGPPPVMSSVGRNMRYQLVLQFRGDSLADYDQMIALEDRLIEDLGHSAGVDGHDCGSGEANIKPNFSTTPCGRTDSDDLSFPPTQNITSNMTPITCYAVGYER